ncbi:MAG: MtrB/PioB family outer membrane beta-barrel protein, partial [Chromatiales bacterium]
MAVTESIERKLAQCPPAPSGGGPDGARQTHAGPSAGGGPVLRRAVLMALGLPCLLMSAAAPAADEEAKEEKEEPWCEYCPDYPPTRGWVSLGVGQSDIDAFRFGRYTGLDDDGAYPYISGWVLHRGKDGWYYEAEGTDLGLDSRDARVEGGRQGRFGVSVEYDETPFREDDTTVTTFRERRADWLGLPALWTDALSTREMSRLPFSLREVDLETDRDRVGVEFSYIPFRKWEITGGYSHETKEGTNDLG